MAGLKTKSNDASVVAFLHTIEPEQKRKDCFDILQLMQDVSGELPKMWGESIIGFGVYHYKYESSQEGDWMRIGFSPRKQNISLYLMGATTMQTNLWERLGKYKTGKSCVYLNKLADIDKSVLRDLIRESLNELKKKYG
jgi:hypothetical protein